MHLHFFAIVKFFSLANDHCIDCAFELGRDSISPIFEIYSQVWTSFIKTSLVKT